MRGIGKTLTLGCMIGLVALLGCPAAAASAGEASPAVTTYTQEEKQLLDAYEGGSLIRLHILAEDNTPEAQRVKLAVRDAILSAFSREWQETDADALYRQLQSKADDMNTIAICAARELGFTGPVSAEVGVFTLPEKQYGSVTLPQGSYRALRITLGTGEGQNWWCVLYPSLCLAVADDDPWRVDPPQEGSESPVDSPKNNPEIVWDAERMLSQWLLWPGV